MKAKTFAAIGFAAALLLNSCWLFNNNKEKPVLNITGKWQLDSCYSTANDSNKNSLALLALAVVTDSSLAIEFKDNKTWKLLHDSSSGWQQYQWKDSLLQLQTNDDTVLYAVNKPSDSLLYFTDVKDSIVYDFIKQ